MERKKIDVLAATIAFTGDVIETGLELCMLLSHEKKFDGPTKKRIVIAVLKKMISHLESEDTQAQALKTLEELPKIIDSAISLAKLGHFTSSACCC